MYPFVSWSWTFVWKLVHRIEPMTISSWTWVLVVGLVVDCVDRYHATKIIKRKVLVDLEAHSLLPSWYDSSGCIGVSSFLYCGLVCCASMPSNISIWHTNHGTLESTSKQIVRIAALVFFSFPSFFQVSASEQSSPISHSETRPFYDVLEWLYCNGRSVKLLDEKLQRNRVLSPSCLYYIFINFHAVSPVWFNSHQLSWCDNCNGICKNYVWRYEFTSPSIRSIQ